MCQVNLQHSCDRLCSLKDSYTKQEGERSPRKRSVVEHGNDTHFVLNLHALHNYQHLQNFVRRNAIEIPTVLTKEQPAQFRADAWVALRGKREEQKKAKAAAALQKKQAKSKGTVATYIMRILKLTKPTRTQTYSG